jgi:hypothetical protein
MKETKASGKSGYFAVMVASSVHVPKQGHGYPAYNHEYWDILEFDSKEQVQAWIKKNHETKNFHVIYCSPVPYKVEVGVTVSF